LALALDVGRVRDDVPPALFGSDAARGVAVSRPRSSPAEHLDRKEGEAPALFHEPDLGGQLTAIAAGPENWREVSSIGLMR